MPTANEWLLFLGASALFAVLPGPGVLYVLARSLGGGRAVGMRSVLGNGLGALMHVAAAAVGLSALLAASAPAFTVVKYLGAAYLIYLGIRALRGSDTPTPDTPAPSRSVVVQGFLSEILNPKTALFFLAFLPHFVHPETAPAPLVFLLLGTIAVAMAVAVDILVALGAAAISAKLATTPRWHLWQRLTTGLTMIGLGGALAAADR
ncbi:LysE family translocator [Actinokineospora sp. NPDC004072]